MLRNKGITLIALVITIIILLILAGISIATLTGENGVLTKANTAQIQTKEKSAKEKIEIAITSSIDEDGSFNVEDFEKEIENLGGTITEKTEETITVEMDDYEAVIDIKRGKIIKFESTKGVKPQVEANLYQENGSELVPDTTYEKVILTVNIKNEDELGSIDAIIVKDAEGNVVNKRDALVGTGIASYEVAGSGIYTVMVKATTEGFQKETTIKVPIKVAPEGWKITTKDDEEWYNYGNSKINAPKLAGEMTPIKYIGENQTGNKWANATTKDGSMWVWIPRYAYKITKGYHTTTAGTIEVAFLDTKDNFLNGETGEITNNPAETGAGISKWLVHPAFTSSAEYGGGFGELEGLWIGKFKATGSITKLSVKPGKEMLRNMTVNEQYQLAKRSKFGENVDLKSHMAKNSEWGATLYLGYSNYGAEKEMIIQNKEEHYYTGGSNVNNSIYTTNKTQSTTYNATGIYDVVGIINENRASYVNNGAARLRGYGGENKGDLYGATAEERASSTSYKMVYTGNGTQSNDYEIAKKYKGDGIYETSNNYTANNSWLKGFSIYPHKNNNPESPFFIQGVGTTYEDVAQFSFSMHDGMRVNYISFRVVLAL